MIIYHGNFRSEPVCTLIVWACPVPLDAKTLGNLEMTHPLQRPQDPASCCPLMELSIAQMFYHHNRPWIH